ncbi:MAG: GNAT family N-acetyltransferase [Bacteroidota bacterium]
MSLIIRALLPSDCPQISAAFRAQGWQDKSTAQYEGYLKLQESGQRDILVAEVGGAFAGYLTINWTSHYPPFRQQEIPEIVDFNVLKKFQRQGIGSALMSAVERRIAKKSAYAGIGVGMTADYGAAQILYHHRGYVPDGHGLYWDDQPLKYGDQVTVDDGLALHFIKRVRD